MWKWFVGLPIIYIILTLLVWYAVGQGPAALSAMIFAAAHTAVVARQEWRTAKAVEDDDSLLRNPDEVSTYWYYVALVPAVLMFMLIGAMSIGIILAQIGENGTWTKEDASKLMPVAIAFSCLAHLAGGVLCGKIVPRSQYTVSAMVSVTAIGVVTIVVLTVVSVFDQRSLESSELFSVMACTILYLLMALIGTRFALGPMEIKLR